MHRRTASLNPTISNDGRYIAFESKATNLIVNDSKPHTQWGVYVHDRTTGETKKASGTVFTGPDAWSAQPSISGDGRYVAFASISNKIVANDTNSSEDVFVRDMVTGSATRASVGSTGSEGTMGSTEPSISSNGRYVAFESRDTFDPSNPTSSYRQVFVHDLETGTTEMASRGLGGQPGNAQSDHASMGSNGTVAFSSVASDLVPNDGPGGRDVFTYPTGGEPSLTSLGTQGQGLSAGTDPPSISGDGLYVIFTSDSPGLVCDDSNDLADVFLAPTAGGGGSGQGNFVVDPSILSRFFPTHGSISVGPDSPQIYQSMFWENSSRLRDLRQSHTDAYEHEAFFPPDECGPGNYSGSWDSNLPIAYLDTDVDDDPADGYSRAGGSAFSIGIATGTWYYHSLGLSSGCNLSNATEFRVKAQDSYRFPAFCASDFAFCVFSEAGSPRDVIPYSAGWRTPSAHTWRYNLLNNESFELGFAEWHLDGSGTESWDTYAGTPDEGSWYVGFTCGGSFGCSVRQDVATSVSPTDLFTFEASLRCNASTDCPVKLHIHALGPGQTETVSRSISVPSFSGGLGAWVTYGFRGTDFAAFGNADTVRVEIQNESLLNRLDVDFTTLHKSDVF